MSSEDIFFIVFRERNEEGEKHRCKKHQLVASCMHSDLRDQTYNLGMDSGQESNPQPFSYRAMFLPAEPH